MDLISRQAAIDAIRRDPMGGLNYRRILKDLPTVDAVEVVRCKDCIHRPVKVWRDEYDEFDVIAPEVDGEEDWRCPCTNEEDPYYSFVPDDDFFCAYGERREGNADAEGKG